MNIFMGKDYKNVLKQRVQEKHGNLTKYSIAAKCQPSYLLRVLKTEAHLTPDQAHRLAEYWALDSDEMDYFLLLVDYARAGDSRHRDFLERKIAGVQREHASLDQVVNRGIVTDMRGVLDYHRDWRISFTHFLSACSKYQTKNALRGRMNISKEELSEILTFLESCEYIKIANHSVKFAKGSGHIPKDSPVLPIFLGNWRQLAVQKSMRKGVSAVHFSNVQTIAQKDLPKLMEVAKQFIRDAKNMCDQSGSDDVVAINLDVFLP